jgi:hypothetical protein
VAERVLGPWVQEELEAAEEEGRASMGLTLLRLLRSYEVLGASAASCVQLRVQFCAQAPVAVGLAALQSLPQQHLALQHWRRNF